MKSWLNKLGKWIFQNKWKTLLGWLVILVVFVGTLAHLGSNFEQNLKISGIPSTDVQKTIKHEFHRNLSSGTMNVVLQGKKGDITKAKTKQDISKQINELKGTDDIKTISNPYQTQAISKDKSTTYVQITFKKDARLVPDKSINNVKSHFNQLKHQNLKVAFNGTVNIVKTDIGGLSEIVGIAIAFILLMILFRSFVTAGMPIISALVGLGTGLILITVGTNFFTVTDVAKTLSVMLSLAVGIDYALFIVHRYRTELNKHDEPSAAMGAALSSAGSSVLFAGVTVIIAVSGLSIIGIDFLTQMGLAAAVSVIFSVLSALTFLPALISLGHKFIKPEKDSTESKVKHAGWFTNMIAHRPLVSAILAVVILLGMAIPSMHMRLGMPYDGALPTNNTKRQAYDMMTDKFGAGINSQLIGIIEFDKGTSNVEKEKSIKKTIHKINNMKDVSMIVPMENKAALNKFQSKEYQAQVKADGETYVKQRVMTAMQQNPQMNSSQQQALMKQATSEYQNQVKAKMKKAVMSPVQMSSNHKYAMFVVIPKTGPASARTENLAKEINSYSKDNQNDLHSKIVLSGSNAVNIDITEKLNKAIPVFATLVMLLAFVLLMIVFRSFVIPLVTMVGFGLSLLASFGMVTLVIQDGFLKSLFGISVGAPVLAFLPVIAIGVLFGLAMDYEVFMVSRIREEYLATHDNEYSVKVGIKTSGPVIITAALIMIAVFGSFILSPDPTIKSIGIMLSFGVFFDAFLVRMIFVPSMIRLFGKYNWKFPKFKQK
ncbi:RND transporter [Fructilactobacillus lindneri]|uniref:RND superfamily resistance-nodulation-cell division proton (H+) antiporter n=2 Tax=Fructilactobacillus lindneri TaxID=53444 RepID=A0A0R2K026_9LACO|nr:MMPL family transporter [Fructilactobacillus lindneri]ANZ57505.1 RND transporter [Fructilactobacillus lindneri]ANZ58773.1 RND transporter [Fructilactobacillus lindneri]KRN80492.1 RND superfamily resistance-nodulation-cell division proton (H+) antiporter [Fructilactobacillus lindneri DSM 20690 = JCM 11027]POG97799.1 RND transporter [Fructilactobacillus lindneri]POG99131.1 RND transporter [Fructilactobacillus lindneri]